MKTLLTAFLILLLVSLAHAATKGRIMTNGKVSLYKNGKVINSFTQQGPVDDNSLIACDGNCLVKIKGVSLIALDQTRFAIKEVENSVNLYIETGKINFAVSDVSKQFSFYTPDGYLVKTEGFITSASTDNSVKGFMQVTDKGTEIGMDTGTMILDTDEGTKTVGPGQAIILAQLPKDTMAGNKGRKDDKAAAALCPFFSWECKTGAQQLTIIGAGAAAFTAGLIVYLDSQSDDDKTVNINLPAEPVVPPPPTASPNR